MSFNDGKGYVTTTETVTDRLLPAESTADLQASYLEACRAMRNRPIKIAGTHKLPSVPTTDEGTYTPLCFRGAEPDDRPCVPKW